MKKVFYILLFAWFGISCTRSGSEVGGEFSETEYYIQGYLEADMLTGTVCTGGLIGLGFSGELYLPSRGEKGDKFRELNAFYGDTHYNKPTYPGGPYALCNEFERIDVISDRDFNDIPAGSSLGSVVELLAASAKPFIDSGYDPSYGWPDGNAPAAYYRDGEPIMCGTAGEGGFSPVYGVLSDLRAEDLKLLYFSYVGCMYLSFLEEPAVKEHTFTVTMQDAAGRTLSCTFEYTF